MKHTKLFACTVISAISTGTFADTLLVPDDYGSIQSAIDIALEGDTVLVSAGIYYETIDFLGKGITVISVDGSDLTHIDGGVSEGSVVTFSNSELKSSILDGFDIRNGSAEDGAGVYILGASPVIRNCSIASNSASRFGAGVFLENASPTFEDVAIEWNTAVKTGGGLYSKNSTFNMFVGSFKSNSGLNGGAIYCKDSTADCLLSAVSFDSNHCTGNGGAVYDKTSSFTLQDCSFTGNYANNGGAWYSYSNGDAEFSNCLFLENTALEYGGVGNIRSNSTVKMVVCTFDTNIADSDCDGVGGSGLLEIGSSSVTLEDPIICVNLVCDVIEDFSADEPIIVGAIVGCSTGLGACCGGDACWEMDYSTCLDGGGVFHGEDIICEMIECFGLNSGACCLGSLCIVTANEDACVDADGIFQGILVECDAEEVECIGCRADINGDGSVEVNDIIEVISSWGACP